MQADLVDFWAVGGEGAEFRCVVPGERSLLKCLYSNLKCKRLFTAVVQHLSDKIRKSVDVPTSFHIALQQGGFHFAGIHRQMVMRWFVRILDVFAVRVQSVSFV